MAPLQVGGRLRPGPLLGAATHKRAVVCGRGTSRWAVYGQKHRPLPTASPQGAACLRPARREASLVGTTPTVEAVAGGQGQPQLAQGSRRRPRKRG
ncbi:hypothetical protein BHM03_00051433 [Ensete ventricosum]|nr:hypothetical protein BHM03_00051433 [Ensete ventricosum]